MLSVKNCFSQNYKLISKKIILVPGHPIAGTENLEVFLLNKTFKRNGVY